MIDIPEASYNDASGFLFTVQSVYFNAYQSIAG